jgi:dTDP-glucose 4,6-dehydratase
MGTSARLRSVFLDNPSEVNRVKVLTHDLTTPFDSVSVEEIGDIDVIINMASESSVDQSILYPRKFVENNVNLMLTMLELARNQASLKLFLHISTDEVYGPAPLGFEHSEWDPIIPSNPYSASKAAQESLAISYWRTYGVPLLITNTMNIIGERQDVEKFVPLCISRILSKRKVPVHARLQNQVWISGSRFYLHARNQADALRFLIEKFIDSPNKYLAGHSRPLRFNVRGEVERTNEEMVHLIAQYLQVDNKDWVEFVNVEGARPGHDLRYALNGQSLHDLGWIPPIPFEESLRRTVEWTARNRAWLSSS